jgi:hypothetical protein
MRSCSKARDKADEIHSAHPYEEPAYEVIKLQEI